MSSVFAGMTCASVRVSAHDGCGHMKCVAEHTMSYLHSMDVCFCVAVGVDEVTSSGFIRTE